jgi:integrase
MPKAQLTKRLIDGLQAGPKDFICWDTELRGFGCKVTPAGKKVFIVQYRFGGRGSRVRKYTIGPYGVVTLKKAQEQAIRVLAEKTHGVDPQAEKSAQRKRLSSDYVADQFERFCKMHASKTRTEQEVRRIFRHDVLPHIGNRTVHTIKKRELVEILNTVQGRGAGIMANRVLAAMRKFFNWLVSQAILEASPCAGIGAPTAERSRDRVLTDDELGRVLKAAQLLDYPFGVIVQLLAHTGQRREEVAGMRWSELDLKKQLWTLPGARTKNKRMHDVALTPQVVELIKGCPPVGHFVASLSADRTFEGWSNSKATLDQKAQVGGWRLHDLRRTMVTYMARAGVAQHVSDRILNHKSGVISSVAAVYQQHDFASERREALLRWSDHLAELCDTIELNMK